MMKFFRKYNKQLLAVFVVLLMLVFVGGSALQFFITPNPGARVEGRIKAFNQEVSGIDNGRPSVGSLTGQTSRPMQVAGSPPA